MASIVIQLLAIAVVGIPALLWATKGKGRGFFSAFLAFLCTVAAAAVAFGVWEPLVYGLLLERLPDFAWGLGLLLPFLITLAVLRVITDQLVKANVDVDDASNFVGGLVLGAASGYIAAGVLMISINFFRVPGEAMGYSPLSQEQGSFVQNDRLWIRADEVVAGAFEHLSAGAFATSTPLAQYMPSAHLQAASQRQIFSDENDGKIVVGKNTLPPGSAEVVGHYVIEGSLGDLLTDSVQPDRRQEVRFIDGSRPGEGSTLHGFVVQFDSLAQERSGQVVIGPGQVRLIARLGSQRVGFHPIAIVATPEAAEGGLYRFRMNASEIFIPSVGGGANAEFVFEFILPPNAQPERMMIKNTRLALDIEREAIASVAARDEQIVTGDLLSNFGAGAARIDLATLDRTGAVRLASEDRGRVEAVMERTTLPSGRILNRGNRGSLVVSDEADGRNRNRIVEGTQKFRPEDFRNMGLDRNLVVQDFMITSDTTMIQVTMVDEGEFTTIGRGVDRGNPDDPLYLIDSEGRRFQAIGYFYEDGNEAEIRFTPGRPLQSLRDYPEISAAKRDQTLILLFRPTRGVTLQYIAVGDRVIAEFPAGGFQTQTR